MFLTKLAKNYRNLLLSVFLIILCTIQLSVVQFSWSVLVFIIISLAMLKNAFLRFLYIPLILIMYGVFCKRLVTMYISGLLSKFMFKEIKTIAESSPIGKCKSFLDAGSKFVKNLDLDRFVPSFFRSKKSDVDKSTVTESDKKNDEPLQIKEDPKVNTTRYFGKNTEYEHQSKTKSKKKYSFSLSKQKEDDSGYSTGNQKSSFGYLNNPRGNNKNERNKIENIVTRRMITSNSRKKGQIKIQAQVSQQHKTLKFPEKVVRHSSHTINSRFYR